MAGFNIYKRDKKERLTVRVLCCALTVLMLFMSLCVAVPSFAATGVPDDEGGEKAVTPTENYSSDFGKFEISENAPENSFILSVSTGNAAGDEVICFEIRYKTDGNDSTMSEFVFPDEGKRMAYGIGYDAGVNFQSARKKALDSIFIYEDGPEPGTSDMIGSALQENSCDQLYFTTSRKFVSLVDIRVHCAYGETGDNTWAYKGMALYKMKVNHGLVQVGAISNEYATVFDGELVARTTGTGNCVSSGKTAFFTFSQAKTDKFGLTSTLPDGNTGYSGAGNSVIFELDVADIAGASIDTLETKYEKTNLTDLSIIECLQLEVVYKDVCGQSRSVYIPFVTSCYAEMVAAINPEKNKSPILGIFQQGDTVACTAYLPDFSSVTKCRMKYSDKPNDFNDLLLPVSPAVYGKSFTDSVFAASALRIYNGSQNTLSFDYADSAIVPALSTKGVQPSWCWVSTSYSGVNMSTESSATNLPMTKYERGVKTRAAIGSSTYLVAITTDASVKQAGTVNDIFLSIDYTKSNGTKSTTDEYSLRKQSDNFYGDWTSKEVNDSAIGNMKSSLKEYGYFYNLNPGRTLYFTMNLADVDSFTGATLRLDGSDEWQMSSFSIYQLASLSRRVPEWESIETVGSNEGDLGNFKSDRVITREFSGIQCVQFSSSVLFQVADSKNISFSKGNVSDKDTDIRWSDYTYYMSYEDTKLDLGFTKARMTYEVTVKVGDDAEGESDCGSKNQFYFQLVFANGKSGYVLANQQLSADGFRTGKDEKFEISVNRDYGALKAIHIIPQNPNNTDEAFDKLKIDYVNVARKGSSGINLTWKIEINDWISIDYSDSGAKDSVSGQAGRSESDIARTYVVTGTGYSTNILVAVTTGGYNNSVQFSGHIFADIRYKDSNDVEQTMSSVDVTKLMYEYAGKTPKTKINVGGTELCSNDKSFMMREYHTDRFMISIEDVFKIESIQFYVYSNETGTWNISNVSMYLVNDIRQRTINANQEYEISCDKEPLTSSDTDTFTVPFTNKTNYSPEIQMNDNEITVKEAEGSFTATVDYVPQNKDDTMNVYVYMSDDAASVKSYDMKCAVSYAVNIGETGDDTSTDKIYQKSVKLKSDPAGNMFYATGVSASGLVNVCRVSLLADVFSNVNTHVRRVVVEHVRSGVAINRYNIPFYDVPTYPVTASASPQSTPDTDTEYRQTVEFMLTDESAACLLGYKTDDIAVCINYTSLDGVTTHNLTSPNVFLSETDKGIIKGGTVCTVNFSQPDVSSITGITFVAMGKLINNVGVKNAYAANYHIDSTGAETCLGWYGFGVGLTTLNAGPRTMQATSSSANEASTDGISVGPVEISVKTAEAATDTESGTSSPVRMVIGYYDKYGNERYTTFNDINNYAVSGSTATGKTITARVLLQNLQSMRSVEFEPYETKYGMPTPTWSIESVNVKFTVNGNETELTRAVNSTAAELNPLAVNLSTVGISVNAFSYNPETEISYNKNFTGTGIAPEGILIDPKGTVTFTPVVSGSSQGVSCSCLRIIDGTAVSCPDVLTVYGSSTEVRSVVFGNDEGVPDGQYRVEFKSAEFPELTLSINVIVQGQKPAEETTDMTVAFSGTDETTQQTTDEETTGEGGTEING